METLKKRFIYKFTANFVRLIVGVFSIVFITRSLGPALYGVFDFITDQFNKIMIFIDTGSSQGLFVKISQRPNERKLLSFYGIIIIMALLLLIVFVLMVFVIGKSHVIWPDIGVDVIYFASIYAFLFWLIEVFTKLSDAYGKTVLAERYRIVIRAGFLFVIGSLFFIDQLTIYSLFITHYVAAGLFIGSVLYILRKNGILKSIKDHLLSLKDIKKYFNEFLIYSHPIFALSIITLIGGVLSRWMLLYFSGPIQQGYFGLSFKLASICILITSSFIPLFAREIAASWYARDTDKMSQLFEKYAPMFYTVSTIISMYFVTNADVIPFILGGEKFAGAGQVLAIMFFLPIHQTYGQFCSTVIFATEKTGLYRNIMISRIIWSWPITFILIAPHAYYGLELGAVGLAISMVATQFLTVNIFIYYISRFINIKIKKLLFHQISSAIIFLVISYGCSKTIQISTTFDDLVLNQLSNLFLRGVVYFLLTILVLYTYPKILALERSDVNRLLLKLRSMTAY